ncbi:MAG: pyridoxamine 5'-phosphate oxidase family protein [Deltaproteobacteria bacterium]|nr:MAG: pyridoxamine 5'-phosphate oxidase family protein [Deltaproteobacteria bacterium]
MAEFYDSLNERIQSFLKEQKLFFVATAPSKGRINLSPKGMDTFRCLDQQTVGYLDVTGSGNETSAHLLDDGRMTLMFCSFTKKPWIIRLYGRGEVIQPGDASWDSSLAHFQHLPGTRQIILLHIESIQASCGYGVPVFEFVEERHTLVKWSEKKGEEGLQRYKEGNNVASIDGLPTHFAKQAEEKLSDE